MRGSSTVGVLVAFALVTAVTGNALATGAAKKSPTAVRLVAVELAAEDPMPGGTYVVIENRGAKRMALGCWRLRTRRADLAIRPPAVVPAHSAIRLLFDRGAAGNPDRIRLVNRLGSVIDATPVLHDTQGDDQLFGRGTGGWTLGRAPLPARLADAKLGKPSLFDC